MSAINKPLLRLAVASSRQAHSPSRGSPHRVASPTVAALRGACPPDPSRRVRGWQLAAEHLRTNLGRTIPSVQSALAAIVSQLSQIMTTEQSASVGDIYADLVAIENEFDDVDFHLRDRLAQRDHGADRAGWRRSRSIRDTTGMGWLTAQKQPIVSSPRILIRPSPIDNVTHPHVMDEHLCEGDGRTAIRQALGQGRLLDFFMLVAGGLRTYNPESPFVALEMWHGETCSDCGAVVDDDERFACQRCDETVCSECEDRLLGLRRRLGAPNALPAVQLVTKTTAAAACDRATRAAQASVPAALMTMKGVFNCHEKEREESNAASRRGARRCCGSVRRPGPNCCSCVMRDNRDRRVRNRTGG